MVKLQHLLLAMAPFVLVALFHHLRFTTSLTAGFAGMPRPRMPLIGAGRHSRMHIPAWRPPIDEAAMEPIDEDRGAPSAAAEHADEPPHDAVPAAAEPEPPEHVLELPIKAMPAQAAASEAAAAPRRVLDTKHYDPPLIPEPDPSVHYPAPTLSPVKLIDGSQNWLPVPNAEGPEPDDLAWRKLLRPDSAPPHCPKGRRPYHTILTAQASTYQEWQTKIMHYHFRKIQKANPCTEMTGFTRLLVSNGGAPDGLMSSMPTLLVPQLGFDKTKGFQVINRPWSLNEVVKTAGWAERVREQYVYIAETDHLILRDIPNRATPRLNVAFFFPYMSPVPAPQAAVVKRYYDGDHLAVQPVGGSPAIMHVDTLKRLAPVWYDMSVKLKADREADRAFGWVLEMWGYSIACARLGIKQFVWQQLQIEPAAAWHQDVSAQDPYIYHYTFGVEYSFEGVPKVGGVGEWSLDKRKYYGRAPPAKLTAPPECAQECASRWHGIFTEAIGALSAAGQWYASTGSDTVRSQRPPPRTPTPLARAIVRVGPWKLADGAEVFFFRRGVAYSRFGGGAWTERDATTVQLTLCSPVSLAFDDPTRPTSFTYNGKQATLAMDAASPARAAEWAHAGSAAVQRLLGEGPWMFRDQQPLAFLWGGVVAGPRGFDGSYAPIDGADDAVALTIGGASYRLKMTGCYTFVATEKGSGATHKGWIPMRHVSMEYTGWRDAGGCTL